MDEMITGYKGFNNTMTCRGKMYRPYETFTEEEKPEVCIIGMHFCKEPFDVLNYYPVVGFGGIPNIYASVSSPLSKTSIGPAVYGDKCATNELHVGGIMDIRELSELIAARARILSKDERCEFSARIFFVDNNPFYTLSNTRDTLIVTDHKTEAAGAMIRLFGPSGIVLLRGSRDLATIRGNDTQLIITGNYTRSLITGSLTRIYNEGQLSEIIVAAKDARIFSSGYGARIKVDGTFSHIFSTGEQASITVTGVGNAVRAGVGSTVSMSNGSYGVSFIVDDVVYKSDRWYCLNPYSGVIEEGFGPISC